MQMSIHLYNHESTKIPFDVFEETKSPPSPCKCIVYSLIPYIYNYLAFFRKKNQFSSLNKKNRLV